MNLILREPLQEDESVFLEAAHASEELHFPWVKAPTTSEEFQDYLNRSKQINQKSFLLCEGNLLLGVFNINEIVRGLFQSAYLGFYAFQEYAGKGYMSAGLKLVLAKVFTDLQLHRLEANIQPENSKSIALVKSNGFCKEGYSPKYLKINGEWRDHERWAILYEDWVAKNAK